MRASRLGTRLAATQWFGGLLYRSGVRQDNFHAQEACVRALELATGACAGCQACRNICPMGLKPDGLLAGQGAVAMSKLESEGCVGCLYCFMICPKRAIAVHGEWGFLREQMERYDDVIRCLRVPGKKSV